MSNFIAKCSIIAILVFAAIQNASSLRSIQFRSVLAKDNVVSKQRLHSILNDSPIISSTNHPMKVAYQGEPGAYSEKASRELLGSRILTIPYKSFEDAFKAVASREVDYAVVPIENSLGGSIHANFDLLLRYDLHIIAEHEFKVEHALLALPNTKKSDIKRVLSHPQALAQCDNYLRNWQGGVKQEPTYDTAGSAKMIRDQQLTDAAAIASDLAAETYGLEIIDSNIEDHDINFTRFLLLSRNSVSSLIPPQLPAKTSIVFVVPNVAGALYKALACFSLRDVDFSKIESRPTSVDLLQHLQFKSQQLQRAMPGFDDYDAENYRKVTTAAQADQAGRELPRFRYTFYLDFLASEFEDRSQNALFHLKEQSEYVRVLGSYPRNSELIGPVKQTVQSLSNIPITTEFPSISAASPAKLRFMSSNIGGDKSSTMIQEEPLKIGIIGFGKFGQFLAKSFVKNGHTVYCVDKDDMSAKAEELNCEFFPLYDLTPFLKADVDVILLSVSIISFKEVLKNLPKDLFKTKLIVDVLSVKVHAKTTMLSLLPADCDILCTHPMFGPESGKYSWQGLPFLYEKIRVEDYRRCEQFLSIWAKERCKMIEMSCEKHDEYAANSQFITHLTGRMLGQQNLVPTPIDTKGFQTVLTLVENTCKDSFDLFFGLYYYNTYASSQLQKIRDALAKVERQLAAKEAYLAARAEVGNEQRNRILEECKALMRDALSEFVPKPKPLDGSRGDDSGAIKL